MHTKIVMPSSWQFEVPIAAQVKMASTGLSGHDYRQFVKRASEEIAHQFKQVKFASGDIPIHLIAMGAKEAWGPNRNGDGFGRDILKATHPSFVKKANWFRNHKNKQPDIRYGIVKASAYNHEMDRVELLVALNGTKEAADRNGGFVADKELEKLAKGEDIPVSMACTVPFDICDACGNKAKTRMDYCKEGSCREGYRGCFSKLAHVYDDGYMQHVLNTEPSFFDISAVHRPACRTAYGNRADYLEKSASWGSDHLTGNQLAEAMGVVPDQSALLQATSSTAEADQIKLAYILSELENAIEDNAFHVKSALSNYIYVNPLRKSAFDNYHFGESVETKHRHLRGLAERMVTLPFEVYATKIAGQCDAQVIKEAKEMLPGIYTDMLISHDMLGLIRRNPFNPQRQLSGHPGAIKFAHDNAKSVAQDPKYVQHQIYAAQLAEVQYPNFVTLQKQAASYEATTLAQLYGMYKLACVYFVADSPTCSNWVEYAGNLVREHYLAA